MFPNIDAVIVLFATIFMLIRSNCPPYPPTGGAQKQQGKKILGVTE